MRHGLVRLCAVMVASVALIPAMGAVAVADPGADLSVTATWVGKGVPKGAVGETVTYAITLTNLGPDIATGTMLTASNPDQLNPVSITCSDRSFCASPGGVLAPGETVTAIVVDIMCCFPKGTSRTTSGGAGVVLNPPGFDPDLTNNTALVATKIVGPHG
jgi:uncharacterized repeat protein (TIGR01451 family)